MSPTLPHLTVKHKEQEVLKINWFSLSFCKKHRQNGFFFSIHYLNNYIVCSLALCSSASLLHPHFLVSPFLNVHVIRILSVENECGWELWKTKGNERSLHFQHCFISFFHSLCVLLVQDIANIHFVFENKKKI